MNRVNSDSTSLDYEVVQGNTLGSLLFLIHTNNISKLKVKDKIFLFAANTAGSLSVECDSEEIVQVDQYKSSGTLESLLIVNSAGIPMRNT